MGRDEMNTEKNVTRLLQILNEREKVIEKATAYVLNEIRPTVLDALRELFEVSDADVEWIDIQAVENSLVLMCIVKFNPYNLSPFLQKTLSFEENVVPANPSHEILKIGLPINQAFYPKETIKKFLMEVADSPDTEEVNDAYLASSVEETFNTNELSPEQLEQLKLFEHSYGGKH